MIPTWQERCEKFDGGKIITYAMINEKMQEEIDELRKELALQRLSDIGQEIENKPVAWIARGDNTSVFFDLDCALSIDDSPTPLYTHPMRELTDEEIESAYWSLVGKQHEGKIASYLYNFARTILKKASEQ